jgi:hypothetical protein
MAQTYFPFDNGSGSNVTESSWGQMAQFWLNTGILKAQLNELNPFADSTGMQVKVNTGMAWIQGFFYKNDAQVILPITTAPTSNSRIDRIVLRVDWAANTIQLAILTGTVAASPTPPALTQNSSKWEISLAQVAVGTNVATIAAGNITDERIFANSNPCFYCLVDSVSYPTASALQQLGVNTSGIIKDLTLNGNNVNVNTAGTYLVEIDASISGLNQNILYELLIRAYKDGVLNQDYNHFSRGINASAGVNLDQIWAHNKIMVYMQKGGYFQFFIRVGEGPRTIQEYFINITRIGD